MQGDRPALSQDGVDILDPRIPCLRQGECGQRQIRRADVPGCGYAHVHVFQGGEAGRRQQQRYDTRSKSAGSYAGGREAGEACKREGRRCRCRKPLGFWRPDWRRPRCEHMNDTRLAAIVWQTKPGLSGSAPYEFAIDSRRHFKATWLPMLWNYCVGYCSYPFCRAVVCFEARAGIDVGVRGDVIVKQPYPSIVFQVSAQSHSFWASYELFHHVFICPRAISASSYPARKLRGSLKRHCQTIIL